MNCFGGKVYRKIGIIWFPMSLVHLLFAIKIVGFDNPSCLLIVLFCFRSFSIGTFGQGTVPKGEDKVSESYYFFVGCMGISMLVL